METPSSGDRYILLIEDNADDEKLILRALKKNRISNPVCVRRDGAQALDFFFAPEGVIASRQPFPQLVMLDLKLPKIDGLEVLKELRSCEATKLLPVIIFTSSREERDVLRTYQLGANSYVRKPIEFGEFSDAVGQLGLYWLVLNESPNPGRFNT